MTERHTNALQGFLGLLVLFSLPFVWAWISHGLWGDDRPYNDAVFPAFRRIESYCISQDFENLTVRCEKVNDYVERCLNPDVTCTADDAHEYYSRLLFDLPPLRKDAAN